MNIKVKSHNLTVLLMVNLWHQLNQQRGRNGQYLGPWAKNWKNKDTLLSQTLKVEEKKVSLVFWFVAQEPRYWHFCNLPISRTSLPMFQKIKWPYLGSWATNKKTKDTFFSSTFKVWESKVSLFFFIYGPGAKILAFCPPDDTVYSSFNSKTGGAMSAVGETPNGLEFIRISSHIPKNIQEGSADIIIENNDILSHRRCKGTQLVRFNAWDWETMSQKCKEFCLY